MSACAKCSKPTTQRCVRCRQKFYCGKECQIACWQTHKTECKIAIAVEDAAIAASTFFGHFFHEMREPVKVTATREHAGSIYYYHQPYHGKEPRDWLAELEQHIVNTKGPAALEQYMVGNFCEAGIVLGQQIIAYLGEGRRVTVGGGLVTGVEVLGVRVRDEFVPRAPHRRESSGGIWISVLGRCIRS